MIHKQLNKFSQICSRISHLRNYSTNGLKSQEVRLPVPWGHIAGKWWGPTDRRPVLSIHGWQDNCGSFERLIPLLNQNIGYLAVDLPGHGRSSHLTPGMFYHQINYYTMISHIVNYFKWDKVSLMGHSLGGVISVGYTLAFQDTVDFLISIDASKPLFKIHNVESTAETITDFLKYDVHQRSSEEPPNYTLEEIKQRIAASIRNSVDIKYSHHIALRNIEPSKKVPGKYYFSRDPRVKVHPFLHWEQKEFVNSGANLRIPMLVFRALDGYVEDINNDFLNVMNVVAERNKDFYFYEMNGTHHTHLNDPEQISGSINEFLDKYYVADTSKGGIKQDIIYEEV